jgi:protein-tyrosine phosphatase
MSDARFDELVDIIEKPRYSEILPQLYLGSIDALSEKEEEENKSFASTLHAVVSLVSDSQRRQDEIAALLPPGCDHMFIPISDSESSNIKEWFEDCYTFVSTHLNAGHKVYVHCMEGRSRSATMMCYIYARERPDLSLLEVVTYVKDCRCIIRPNSAFISQLIEAYDEIKK